LIAVLGSDKYMSRTGDIPNSVMGNAKIVHEADGSNERWRIRVSVGVAYGRDTDQVQEVTF
jgi:MscS family membrane protein